MKGRRNYRGLISLAGLLILAPVITYRLTLYDTVGMWSSARKLRGEIENRLAAAPAEGQVAAVVFDGKDVIQNGELITELERLGALKGLSVERYVPTTAEESGGLHIQTAEIGLSGPYKQVLRAIRVIEERMPACKVSSVTFKGVRARQAGVVHLQTTIIVQQLTDK